MRSALRELPSTKDARACNARKAVKGTHSVDGSARSSADFLAKRYEVALYKPSGWTDTSSLRKSRSATGAASARSMSGLRAGVGIAVITPPLPVHLVYPPMPFQPARLRRFLDAMREAMPAIVAASTAPRRDR